MTDWAEGDPVEVYDGDRQRWCPGTVQSTWHQTDISTDKGIPLEDMVVIRSENEFEGTLPLMWAVPVSFADQVVRARG